MQNKNTNRPQLPEGWEYPDAEAGAGLHDELQRELPHGHLLYGVAVETFAAAIGNDDVLFRHMNQQDRFTVIHLTWIGKTEINAQHPAVEFDGTYAEFLEDQERRYGLQVRGK